MESNFFVLLGFACAFAVMAVTGRAMIAWLKSLKGMKWSAREDTPDTHLQKAGTPSMGGLGIVFAALMAYCAVMMVIWFWRGVLPGALIATPITPPIGAIGGVAGRPVPFDVLHIALAFSILPLITIAHLALGWIDDWSKATGRGGLRARAKFAAQLGLATAFLFGVYWLTAHQNLNGIRFFASGSNGDFLFNPLVPFELAFVFGILLLTLVATCNAVNITDGIDGLASGVAIQSFVALWIVGSNVYDVKVWTDVWCLCLAGGCAGFLLFNKFKAQVFMGDTGSLALGAALGAAAIMTRSVFLLPFIGFMFFVEMFSVMSQVLYFKYTRKKFGEGRRIFRRAPLHHHFELGGWSEWRVVLVFWAINAAMVIIGLGLWSVGILPRFP